jgi:hypothetical protein
VLRVFLLDQQQRSIFISCAVEPVVVALAKDKPIPDRTCLDLGVINKGSSTMTRSQSDKAYRDWVERRKVEDALSAKLAEQQQASRWHNFQRDEGHIRTRDRGIQEL